MELWKEIAKPGPHLVAWALLIVGVVLEAAMLVCFFAGWPLPRPLPFAMAPLLSIGLTFVMLDVNRRRAARRAQAAPPEETER